MENPFARLAVMVKFGKMMTPGDCDFIQPLTDVASRDADWIDWFIGVDKVKNKTGEWFFGVVALKDDVSRKF